MWTWIVQVDASSPLGNHRKLYGMSVGSCSSTREVMMSSDVWQQEWMLRWMVAWRSQMGLNMGIMTAAIAATLSTVIQHLWSNRD
jgi:hypothetical protein